MTARIARFIRFWGMETYRGATMRWPTRDGVIPFRLFNQLEASIANVAATEQVQQYYATALGVAAVMGSKESRPALDAALCGLRQLAYPEDAE